MECLIYNTNQNNIPAALFPAWSESLQYTHHGITQILFLSARENAAQLKHWFSVLVKQLKCLKHLKLELVDIVYNSIFLFTTYKSSQRRWSQISTGSNSTQSIKTKNLFVGCGLRKYILSQLDSSLVTGSYRNPNTHTKAKCFRKGVGTKHPWFLVFDVQLFLQCAPNTTVSWINAEIAQEANNSEILLVLPALLYFIPTVNMAVLTNILLS